MSITRMRRCSFVALGYLALGCGGSGGEGPKADPAPVATAAPTSTAVVVAEPAGTVAEPAPTAKPDPAVVPAPDDVPPAASLGILKHMPTGCDEGRVYVNVAAIVNAKSAASIDAMIGKAAAKEKAGKVLQALKGGGVDPVKSTQEIAVCATKDRDRTVVVVNIDMQKAKDPAGAIARAIEVGDGAPPKKEVSGDVTILESSQSDDLVAVVGKSTLVFGNDKATVLTAVKGGNGAGFGRTVGHAVFVEMASPKTLVTAKDSGADFDVEVALTDARAEQKRREIEEALKGADAFVSKAPAGAQRVFKPLLPAVKAAVVEARGESLTVRTKLAKTAIPEAIGAASQLKPQEIMKALRF